MNRGRLVWLLIALALSAAVAAGAYQLFRSELRQARAAPAAPPPPPLEQVLVAVRPIPAGAPLAAEALRWRPWPAEAVLEGFVTDGGLEQFAEAVARRDIQANEPVTRSLAARPGERGAMSVMLRPGYRAIALNVSPSTGVAGFVGPGDHVDVILTRAADQGGGRQAG